MQCLSCKNRNTTERCDKNALRGCIFCGTHMRMKTPRHWIVMNPQIRKSLIRAQAIWRGYWVRYKLKLAGEGALKRSICHNDDELVTMESKTDISPFDYFSITQDGKVWWFDVKTMLDWSTKNLVVTNPFTRLPLSAMDTRRLRDIRFYRNRLREPITHIQHEELPTLMERLNVRWLRVTQVIHECGFGEMDIHPEHFLGMSWGNMRLFVGHMVQQTRFWMYERTDGKDPYAIHSRRAKCHIWLRSIRNSFHCYSDVVVLSYDISRVLLGCIQMLKDPLDFVFFILSALINCEVGAVL